MIKRFDRSGSPECATTHISPQIWAGIIVIVQVAEAAERGWAIPARYAAISELCAGFNALFIEARQEWEEIAAGKRTEEQTRKAWGRLLDRRSQADRKAFPRGLPPEKKFKRLAKAEADAYFESQFPQEEA
jgi:RNA polymerase subunit RPABC4/transcription elongation factor Spt4